MLTRRALLQTTGGLAILLPLSTTAGCSLADRSTTTGETLNSEIELPKKYARSLPIPERLRPVRSDATTDYFEIEQSVARQELLPGVQTTVWGYNGTFPGPTIDPVPAGVRSSAIATSSPCRRLCTFMARVRRRSTTAIRWIW